jgi:hypothetical protein
MADKTIDPRQVLFEYGANALASNHPEGGNFHIDDTMIDEALQALLAAIDDAAPTGISHSCSDDDCIDCAISLAEEERDKQWRDAIHKLFGEKS